MTLIYEAQIASQPAALREVLARIVVPALDARRPIVLCGLGTSLHACRVAAFWAAEVTGGAVRPAVVDAHELALRAPLTLLDQIVVVSHRARGFALTALARARAIGAHTIAVIGKGAAEPEADCVLRTCDEERADTHTVSYLCALAVLARLMATLGDDDSLAHALELVPDAIERTLTMPLPAVVSPILITGFATDAITATEAALKLKEGTRRWAEGMAVEQALHGPQAALRYGDTVVTIVPNDDGGRTPDLTAQAMDRGARVLTAAADAGDLPFAKVPHLARPFVTIVPFQRWVAKIAREIGTNPDVM